MLTGAAVLIRPRCRLTSAWGEGVRGVRELLLVLLMAVAGVALAATVALAPWYPGPAVPGPPVVKLVVPGAIAGRR
jgi:hypothetical protein